MIGQWLRAASTRAWSRYPGRMRSVQHRTSHSTCWLNRVENQRARIAWRAGGCHLRRSLEVIDDVAVRSRMS
eukprot:2081618-Pyramimonas_sp.AAC.1